MEWVIKGPLGYALGDVGWFSDKEKAKRYTADEMRCHPPLSPRHEWVCVGYPLNDAYWHARRADGRHDVGSGDHVLFVTTGAEATRIVHAVNGRRGLAAALKELRAHIDIALVHLGDS